MAEQQGGPSLVDINCRDIILVQARQQGDGEGYWRGSFPKFGVPGLLARFAPKQKAALERSCPRSNGKGSTSKRADADAVVAGNEPLDHRTAAPCTRVR